LTHLHHKINKCWLSSSFRKEFFSPH